MSRLSGALIIGLGAMLQLSSVRAQGLDGPPPPGKPRPVPIVTPVEQTLANGLRVIVAPRPGVLLVTATLMIRSGSEGDPPQRAGLADLTATLLTQGTRTRSAPAIAEATEALGGSFDSAAGWDRSRISITVTTVKLPAALTLLADVVRYPSFAPAELERARRQAIDGLRVAYSEPGTVAQMAAARAVFGTGTYGEPRAGTPASLRRIRQSDLVRLHGTYYRPDNAILVFAGDITPAEAVTLANQSFGDWMRPPRPLPIVTRVTDVPASVSTLVIGIAGAGQAGVVVGLPGIARRSGDYYAGLIANAVLGGTSSSRLSSEIRVKRGLTYDVRSILDARRYGGLMIATVQTNNPSAPEVVELVLAEFDRLAEQGVEGAELSARASNLIGAYARSLETTAGLAARVGELAIHDIDLAEIGQVTMRIEAVTPADVQRFAATHWRNTAMRVIVAGDTGQFIEVLRKSRPDAIVIPIGDLDLEQAHLGSRAVGR